MAGALQGPNFYAWDNDTGKPLAFGKVYTYEAGTNIPKATFTGENEQAENPNPVILNGAGYAPVYLRGSYKIVVKDADDVEVWAADPVSDASSLLQPWIQETAATQVVPNQFKVTGNQTDVFRYGRSVKLDDKVIFYGTVTGSSYTSGETTVTIDAVDNITSELTRVWASLVDLESLLPVLKDEAGTTLVKAVTASLATFEPRMQERFDALLASSGYEFIGNYQSGIEVTEYNQVIRDPSGEMWRASITTTLPYTTDGSGMPEGGAFVSAGDAVLRSDLVHPVATFDNVAQMKASTRLDVGRKARTLGYYSPGDGGGNDYSIVAAGTGTDDGGSFIDLSWSGFQAKGLFVNGNSDLRQFGSVSDEDNTSIVNAAAASVDRVYVPPGHDYTRRDSVIPRSVYFIDNSTGIPVSNKDWWWRPQVGPVEMIAHRGFMDLAPENTLAAISNAWLSGAHGVEFDVYQTADGVPVVIHDATVDRTTNSTGSVSSFTLEQIQQLDAGSSFSPAFAGARIPSLEDVLRYCKGKFKRVRIESKISNDPSFSDKIIALVKELSMYDSAHYVTFSLSELEYVRSVDKDIKLDAAGLAPSNIDRFAKLGGKLYCSFSSPSRDRVDMARDSGIDVYGRIISNKRDSDEHYSYGITALHSDNGMLLEESKSYNLTPVDLKNAIPYCYPDPGNGSVEEVDGRIIISGVTRAVQALRIPVYAEAGDYVVVEYYARESVVENNCYGRAYLSGDRGQVALNELYPQDILKNRHKIYCRNGATYLEAGYGQTTSGVCELFDVKFYTSSRQYNPVSASIYGALYVDGAGGVELSDIVFYRNITSASIISADTIKVQTPIDIRPFGIIKTEVTSGNIKNVYTGQRFANGTFNLKVTEPDGSAVDLNNLSGGDMYIYIEV